MFSLHETAKYSYKRTSDDQFTSLGVNCSCFSLYKALGGAREVERLQSSSVLFIFTNMKHFYLRTLMFLLMSMVGRSTFAYDVEIDGIYYNLNYAEKTAEVTSGGKDSYYYGEVIIPAEITLSPGPFIPASKMANTLSENTYKVTSIGEGVFKQSGITSIIIGDNVSSGVAFQYCNHLTNVVIGKSVTDIDFYQSNNITTVTFHCKEIGNWFNTYGGRYVKEIIIGEESDSQALEEPVIEEESVIDEEIETLEEAVLEEESENLEEPVIDEEPAQDDINLDETFDFMAFLDEEISNFAEMSIIEKMDEIQVDTMEISLEELAAYNKNLKNRSA